MRYSVRFPTLLRCYDRLEETVRRHSREIEELRQVRQSLSRLSGMERVLAGIDQELEKMEDQRRVLLIMAQAVRQAHRIYTDTENAVIDEADCPYRALTELKLTEESVTVVSTAKAKYSSGYTVSDVVEVTGDIVIKVERLNINACAALLSEMDVTLKAAL